MPKSRSTLVKSKRTVSAPTPPLWIRACPSALKPGLAAIEELDRSRFENGPHGRSVSFRRKRRPEGKGYEVCKNGENIEVSYSRPTDAFRALGRLLGERTPEELAANFSEVPRFKTLGVMLDVSRNGVLQVDAVKHLLRRFALMGINMTILYTEDTYEVPGEPFFGYLRGRYTAAELREMDRYAASLGIEMFPCIQVLAHLKQILKWPAYEGLRDVEDVLLADDKKTYALLRRMIRAASAPFRSRRIHLGMDEAHGIGTGNYLKRFGCHSPFAVLNRHLRKVCAICREDSLRPMIWSDMYFRLGSKTGDYYDPESKIPARVAGEIPADVQLVYWDYFHTDETFYREWIARHRKMKSEPVMAGGVWNWSRFWTNLPFSFAATDACMKACKSAGLEEAFVTLWGDDGMECDPWSALPGIQHFAEHGYADQVDPARLRSGFAGSCGASLDAWVRASDLDSVPGLPAFVPKPNSTNISKWLLWDDPLLGIAQPHLPRGSLKKHYAELAVILRRAARKSPADRRLLFPAELARVLALKCDLRRRIVAAYRKRDAEGLASICRQDLPGLKAALVRLWKMHRRLWINTFKPFGWEVLEQRYGGLLARLDGLAERLRAWAADPTVPIPEFDADLLPLLPAGSDLPHLTYGGVSTATCVR